LFVRALSWITGFPQKVWIRLAPLTEQMFFSSLAYTAVRIFRDQPSLLPQQVLAGAIGFVMWLILHDRVLTSVEGRAEWTPLRELTSARKVELAALGLIVVGLPIFGFSEGLIEGIVLSLIAVAIHGFTNGLEPANGAIELLDSPQRAVRTLESSV
jgi:hypothetical protein